MVLADALQNFILSLVGACISSAPIRKVKRRFSAGRGCMNSARVLLCV